MPSLMYQRFLEQELPAGVPAGTVPMWSWPVPLSGGGTILTLLYRPLAAPSGARFGPATQILHLNERGEAEVWKPGVGYPAPVIFYGNKADDLVGLDLSDPRKLYACRVDGRHLWTLEAGIRMDNLIAPASFHQRGDELYWRATSNELVTATLRDGVPTEVRAAESPPEKPAEVHHPHTHVVKGRLYVLDFDPMARVTCYRID